MNSFPCTGCGMCCRMVGLAVRNAKQMVIDGVTDSYVQEVAKFPFKANEAGACEHLQADHGCAVYESRPDICSIAKTWEKHHSENISREDYFISTAELCNELIAAEGMGDNFFIKIEHNEY